MEKYYIIIILDIFTACEMGSLLSLTMAFTLSVTDMSVVTGLELKPFVSS